MGARFDAATDKVTFAGAGIPNPSAGLTVLWWAQLSVNRGEPSTMLRMYAAGTILNVALDPIDPAIFTVGGDDTWPTDPLTVSQWAPLGITIGNPTGTSAAVHESDGAGGVETITGTVSGGANATPTGYTIGGRSASDDTEWFNGGIAHLRIWPAVLSDAEKLAEWASPTAVRSSGLFADYPFDGTPGNPADLTDHSGNGRHLTAGSTPALFLAGPVLTVAPAPAGRMLSFFP